jgi:hypothetical protein
MRTLVSLTTCTLALMLLAGCSAPTDHRLPINVSPTVARLDRAIAVDVENYNGSVRIQVVPGLQRPEITAEVWDESNGFMRRTDDAIVRGWYAANLTTQEGRPVLRVLTTRTANSTPPTFVKLTVKTPTLEGVRVRNNGGDVEVRGGSGPITIENGFRGGEGGNILVVTPSRLSDPVRMTTTKGDVELRIAPSSQGSFELTALKGHVAAATRTEALTRSRRTATTWTGVMNSGTNKIELMSQDGDVTLDVGDSRQIEPSI